MYFAFPLCQLIDKQLGNIRVNGTRSMGRQLHMIPVDASTIVQVVEVMVPKFWSSVLDAALRVVKRMIVVVQTLNVIFKSARE